MKRARVGIPDSDVSTVSTFAPYDRKQFLQRLETFRSIRRWNIRGEDLQDVNEVQWAKRGWVCDSDATNEVKCRQCGKRVVVDIPDEPFYWEEQGDDTGTAEEDAVAKGENQKQSRPMLLERYKELIVKGHEETCPWYAQGCDAAIQRLTFGNREKCVQGLRDRYFSMLDLATNLPEPEAIAAPCSFELQEVLKTLPQTFFDPSVRDEDFIKSFRAERDSTESTGGTAVPNKEALLLASYGWQGMAEDGSGMAICSACFRRIGFWLCKEPGQLNPEEAHATYCPWVNADTQTGHKTNTSDGVHLSGVQQLLQSVTGNRASQADSASIAPSTIRPEQSTIDIDATLDAFTLQTLDQFELPVPTARLEDANNVESKYAARRSLVAKQISRLKARYQAASRRTSNAFSDSDDENDDFYTEDELLRELKLKRIEQVLLENAVNIQEIDDYIRKLKRKFAAEAEKIEQKKLDERKAGDKALFSRLRKIREKFNVKPKRKSMIGK